MNEIDNPARSSLLGFVLGRLPLAQRVQLLRVELCLDEAFVDSQDALVIKKPGPFALSGLIRFCCEINLPRSPNDAY